MNAKQLIEQTKTCAASKWQNSNLPRNVEEMLETISEHFEKCEDCRNQFDAEQYESETLIEFSSELHMSNTKMSDWICVPTPNEQEIAKKQASDEATVILSFLQNIDDIDEATQFMHTWIKAVNAGLKVRAEPEIDDVLFKTAIAKTDRRFWDVEMGDQK